MLEENNNVDNTKNEGMYFNKMEFSFENFTKHLSEFSNDIDELNKKENANFEIYSQKIKLEKNINSHISILHNDILKIVTQRKNFDKILEDYDKEFNTEFKNQPEKYKTYKNENIIY